MLGKHISPKSRLIHDEERSHSVLIRNLELFSEVHSTIETKRLSDKDNPLDPINDVHNLIRRFMRAHGGYNRDNLQDWMNLIWFILSKPDNTNSIFNICHIYLLTVRFIIAHDKYKHKLIIKI